MADYYSEKLSAERLRQCYTLAPPRVQQYLQAEVDFVLSRISDRSDVLELGCGYGRVMASLTTKSETVFGIDLSEESLFMARDFLSGCTGWRLACMDAARLGFKDAVFDVVVCLQNGISAFHREKRRLIEEGLRVLRPGGVALFSSYSPAFWEDRLNWFEAQAEAGLLGRIDYDRTGGGKIICEDGFTATTLTREEFKELTSDLKVAVEIVEVDHSSLFCALTRLDTAATA